MTSCHTKCLETWVITVMAKMRFQQMVLKAFVRDFVP